MSIIDLGIIVIYLGGRFIWESGWAEGMKHRKITLWQAGQWAGCRWRCLLPQLQSVEMV